MITVFLIRVELTDRFGRMMTLFSKFEWILYAINQLGLGIKT